MAQYVSRITLLVTDQDEALKYYTEILGFRLVEDRQVTPTKRWVVVAPAGSGETGFLLSLASDEQQQARVGNQTGGKVLLVLRTDDFENDLNRLKEHEVRIVRGPVTEPWGDVVVFEDLYGNKWDLVGR
ncbi:MAG: VOC family protein [Bacteroidota bacterium]